MKIVRYAPEHLEIVEELYDRLRFSDEDYAVMYADLLEASKKHDFYLVFDDEVPVGFFFITKNSFGMYVIPERRREGIGTLILKNIIELHKNTPRILVNVIKKNEAAITLYIKLGFREIGNIKMEKGPGITLEYSDIDINERLKEAVHYWKWCYRRNPKEYIATGLLDFGSESAIQWEWISKHLNSLDKVDTVLDYGCGIGRFTKSLGDVFNAKVTGCDIFNECVDDAIIKYPGICFFLLNKALDIPDTDVIFSMNTLCYVHGFDIYDKVVEQIRKHVKKYVVLFEPFHDKIEVDEPQLRIPKEKVFEDLPEFEWTDIKPPKISGVSENHMLLVGRRKWKE